MSFTPIPNHVQAALNRLISQYKGKPVISGLLSAIVAPVQDIENALTDMNNLRYLPQATGAQLDVIGVIVGLPRPKGMSDASYLLELYGQIKINTSEGQPEQMIQAFLLFTQQTQCILDEFRNASFIIESPYLPPDQASADQLILTLNQAKPAGVRIDGFLSYDLIEPFAYAGNLPGLGYDDGSGTVGGKYAEGWQYVGPGFAYDGDDPSGMGYGSSADPLSGGCYLLL